MTWRTASASTASPFRWPCWARSLIYGTFTEIVGTLARRRPERAGALALLFLRPLEWLLVPLADPLAVVGRAVGRRVPKARTVDARITETEVEWAVSEGEKAGAIANGPAEMIRKVLDFKDLTAREVMVPRRHILGIELATAAAGGGLVRLVREALALPGLPRAHRQRRRACSTRRTSSS